MPNSAAVFVFLALNLAFLKDYLQKTEILDFLEIQWLFHSFSLKTDIFCSQTDSQIVGIKNSSINFSFWIYLHV